MVPVKDALGLAENQLSIDTCQVMNSITEKCKQVLTNHYGSRLASIILYGSMARNESNSESDIDLLVLLNSPFDYFQELRTIVNLLHPIQLESDRLISAKPVAIEDFEVGSLQFYRNAKREGLKL